LVLSLVSSTLPCIRQPRPRLRVLDICGFVLVCTQAFIGFFKPMSAWLITPPSSGTLAFSLRLAPSLPAADFPAFYTGYSASPPLAYSPFPGASSAIPPPYRLLRHFGFLTSPHAYHTCNKRPFTSLRLVRSFTDHSSVARAHLLQLPPAPRPLLCTSTVTN
jgi:hypothetical protein